MQHIYRCLRFACVRAVADLWTSRAHFASAIAHCENVCTVMLVLTLWSQIHISNYMATLRHHFTSRQCAFRSAKLHWIDQRNWWREVPVCAMAQHAVCYAWSVRCPNRHNQNGECVSVISIRYTCVFPFRSSSHFINRRAYRMLLLTLLARMNRATCTLDVATVPSRTHFCRER